MSFDICANVESDLLRMVVSGPYRFDLLFDLIERIRAATGRAGRDAVLVDCRPIEGDMTEVERFAAGQHIAEVFGSRISVAVVMPEVKITKLGELAAVNRGAKLLVTSSETEAREWLLKQTN